MATAIDNTKEDIPAPDSVSSTKRKLGEALSPESISLDSEVSGKSIVSSPLLKKRNLLGKRGKKLRAKTTRPYKPKQPQRPKKEIVSDTLAHDNSSVIDEANDDNDDDYDTTDELPLSGLVRGQHEREPKRDDQNSNADSDLDQTGQVQARPKPCKARKRNVNIRSKNVTPSAFELGLQSTLFGIQNDLQSMKIDGSKRDITLSTLNTSISKLAGEAVSKGTLDETLTDLVVRMGGVLDDQK